MKNNVIAALLAFFLGVIGAQWYYLGNKTRGTWYLVGGTIGWILFFPGLIVCILSIVDGIRFLCMNDQEFESTYGISPDPYTKASRNLNSANAISQFAELRDKGYITDEEFEAKKAELLK